MNYGIYADVEGVMFGKVLTRVIIVVLIVLGLFVEYGDGRTVIAGSEAISSDSWQYPVRLGDLRERVHKLLGGTSRTTPDLEEYPESGVTVWFDREGRVTKLNFAGEACAVYASASFAPIISKQQILFGLTARTDEAEFRRVLGGPARESYERSTSVKELRCVWKKGGYVVDALFLVAERNHEGKTFPKGTLLWFEVFRGL
jgi:hypothetical protein